MRFRRVVRCLRLRRAVGRAVQDADAPGERHAAIQELRLRALELSRVARKAGLGVAGFLLETAALEMNNAGAGRERAPDPGSTDPFA